MTKYHKDIKPTQKHTYINLTQLDRISDQSLLLVKVEMR